MPVRCAQSEPPHKRSFCQCLHFPLPFCFSSNPPVVLLAALVSLNIIFSAVDGLLKYEVHKSLDNVTSTAVSVLFSLSDRPAWHGGSTGPGEQHPRTTVWLPSVWDIAVIPRGTAGVGGLENQHWALLSPDSRAGPAPCFPSPLVLPWFLCSPLQIPPPCAGMPGCSAGGLLAVERRGGMAKHVLLLICWG